MPTGVGWAGSLTFHSRTRSLELAAARTCPLGLNATDSTRLVDAARIWDAVCGVPSGVRWAPGRHSWIFPSAYPVAMRFPTGAKATALTRLCLPPGGLAVAVSVCVAG